MTKRIQLLLSLLQTAHERFRGVTQLTMLTLCGTTCSLVSIVLISRLLDTRSFGVLSLGLALQPVLLTIGTLGTRALIIRDETRKYVERSTLLGTHFVLTFAASTIAAVALVASSFIWSLSSMERTLFLLIAIGNIGNSLNIVAFYDAHHRQVINAILQLIVEISSLIAIALLAHVGQLSATTVGVVFAAKWILASIAGFIAFSFVVGSTRVAFVANHIEYTLNAAWPLVIGNLLTMIPVSLGVLAVRIFHSPTDVALIGIAQQIASGYLLLSSLAIRVVEPRVSYSAQAKRGLVPLHLLFSVYLLAIMAGLLACAIGLFNFYLSPAYKSAIYPTVFLLAAAFAYSIGRLATIYLVAFHRERLVLLAHVAGVLVFCGAAVTLVPSYSYTGAGVASLFSTAVSAALILSFVFTMRDVELPVPNAVACKPDISTQLENISP